MIAASVNQQNGGTICSGKDSTVSEILSAEVVVA
jgi:hypothetical protein